MKILKKLSPGAKEATPEGSLRLARRNVLVELAYCMARVARNYASKLPLKCA